MRRSIRLALTTLLASGVAATVLAVARPTMALEAGATSARGACNGHSEWSLTANQDIGLEFELGIESGVADQTWHFAMYNNGSLMFKGNQVTDADGGVFGSSFPVFVSNLKTLTKSLPSVAAST